MKKLVIIFLVSLVTSLLLSIYVFNTPRSISNETQRNAIMVDSDGNGSMGGCITGDGTKHFGFPLEEYSYSYTCNDDGREGSSTPVDYSYFNIFLNFLIYAAIAFATMLLAERLFFKYKA